jgi:hypothetical protein
VDHFSQEKVTKTKLLYPDNPFSFQIFYANAGNLYFGSVYTANGKKSDDAFYENIPFIGSPLDAFVVTDNKGLKMLVIFEPSDSTSLNIKRAPSSKYATILFLNDDFFPQAALFSTDTVSSKLLSFSTSNEYTFNTDSLYHLPISRVQEFIPLVDSSNFKSPTPELKKLAMTYWNSYLFTRQLKPIR